MEALYQARETRVLACRVGWEEGVGGWEMCWKTVSRSSAGSIVERRISVGVVC